MKNLKTMKWLLCVAVMAVFSACSKDEPNDEPTGEGKAKIENFSISPTANLKYGDVVTLAATLSDNSGLRSYTIKVSNAAGDLYEDTQMLTGKTFPLSTQVVIPLPPNATAGDITVSLTVKNTDNQLTSEERELKNVTLPTFTQLYVVINNTTHEMTKVGDVFEFEDFIAAGATGKFYANADRSGAYWGLDGAAVKAMGANDITFGKTEEAFFKITFNPVSCVLNIGGNQLWSAMSTNALYILGTISGHWEDGEITVEKTKMKMTGASLGTRKMWTWTPPNTGTGLSVDDMWGNINPGNFRFKKSGVEEYILYADNQITIGPDNKANSFVAPAGGSGFTIRIMADGDEITSVKIFDATRNLEYLNGKILVNGVEVVPNITFAGTSLTLKPGSSFVHEGTLTLTKEQSITATGINLASVFADPDVFTGSGNATWKFIQESSSYYITVDQFNNHIYIREETGYPKAIYMDGWGWKKHPADPRPDWNVPTALTLYQKAGTTNVFEATFYIYPWGGDFNLFAYPPHTEDGGKTIFFAEDFTGIDQAMSDRPNMKFPASITAAGYYKLSVNLQDGFDVDKTTPHAEFYTVTPKNGKKFTAVFTAQ
jgi:hypothetical protein